MNAWVTFGGEDGGELAVGGRSKLVDPETSLENYGNPARLSAAANREKMDRGPGCVCVERPRYFEIGYPALAMLCM